MSNGSYYVKRYIHNTVQLGTRSKKSCDIVLQGVSELWYCSTGCVRVVIRFKGSVRVVMLFSRLLAMFEN